MGAKKTFLSRTSACFPEHLHALTEGEECGCLPCASLSVTSTVCSHKLLILLYLNICRKKDTTVVSLFLHLYFPQFNHPKRMHLQRLEHKLSLQQDVDFNAY